MISTSRKPYAYLRRSSAGSKARPGAVSFDVQKESVIALVS